MTDVRLAQLLDAAGKPYDFVVAGDPRTYQDLVSPANLKWISTYADGIGANKNLLVPRDATGKLLAPTAVIRDAHRTGLVVHAWTFRAENQFLAGRPPDRHRPERPRRHHGRVRAVLLARPRRCLQRPAGHRGSRPRRPPSALRKGPFLTVSAQEGPLLNGAC